MADQDLKVVATLHCSHELPTRGIFLDIEMSLLA